MKTHTLHNNKTILMFKIIRNHKTTIYIKQIIHAVDKKYTLRKGRQDFKMKF